MCTSYLIVPILLSMLVERILLLRPALTFVSKLHLVPMATNEPLVIFCSDCLAANRTESAQSESTESVCTTPVEPAIELEVRLPAPIAPLAPVAHHPCTQLIFDNLSLFYSELGYVVTQTMHNSAHLHSLSTIELHHLGRNTCLTPVSEIRGVPL